MPDTTDPKTGSSASTLAFENAPKKPAAPPPRAAAMPPRPATALSPLPGSAKPAGTVAFEKSAPTPPVASVATAPQSTGTIGYEKPVGAASITADTIADAKPVAENYAALTDTVAAESPLGRSLSNGSEYALDATQAAAPLSSQSGEHLASSMAEARLTSTQGRTTVLPRVILSGATPQWGVDNRPRYQRVKSLGEGGMGEVALMEDHDIERKVAVKKLRAEVQGTTALLRFAEEIKVIGQLEHPNIIPIHDVGIDEAGQHYFVMKYVNGETLEHIIEKLREGDPTYAKRFTFEHRTQIFVAILQALRYAHAQGIIHRDIKPANIMVGPFGEVTVMDWGLAKKVRNADGTRVADTSNTGGTGEAPSMTAKDRKKLIETQHGALLGTPLYMSPEQAAGKINELDERSDNYSLAVLFHEMITLEHYLSDKETMGDVLAAVVAPERSERVHFSYLLSKGVPAELCHFLLKAMDKDPANRFQKIDDMVDRLEAIGNGEILVQCHVTWFKHMSRQFLKWVDRHPVVFTVMMTLFAVLMLFGGVSAVFALLHAFK